MCGWGTSGAGRVSGCGDCIPLPPLFLVLCLPPCEHASRTAMIRGVLHTRASVAHARVRGEEGEAEWLVGACASRGHGRISAFPPPPASRRSF